MTAEATKEALKQRIRELEEEIAALSPSGTPEVGQSHAGQQSCEQYYRMIVENAADLIFTVNENGEFVYISPNCRAILGYGPEEFVGKPFVPFVHPDEVESILGILSEIFIRYQSRGAHGVGRMTLEYRALTRDGQWRWLSAKNTIVKETGNHLEVVCIARDITEQKEAARKLEESEQRYRFLVEESNDIIWTFDLSSMTFVYVSRSVERILGIPQDQASGVGLDDIFDPETEKKIRTAFETAAADPDGDGRVMTEADHLGKNGRKVSMEVNAVLHRDAGGKPVSFTGVSRDITERNAAVREREKLQAQLRHARQMEAIGTLAGGIAHDFNNILFSVIGYTELAIDEAAEGSQLHQNLCQVLAAGNRARDLVRQILAITRNEKQAFRPVPVSGLVREALETMRAGFPRDVALRENICHEQLTVNADPLQLHQVIANLAANAGHAMQGRYGVVEVKVTRFCPDQETMLCHPDAADGDYARISVSDTGPGIDKQDLGKIFEPYFTTRKEGTGTGLGLSIVHGIVKVHKGFLTVDSEPGRGSVFHVHLPLVRDDWEADSPDL
ncbi:MAG: PAS domain S-box protein [Desulfobacteraceae bacterium]|nr:PAS domain S-box protein [Desulfobacteraceae bacterium]